MSPRSFPHRLRRTLLTLLAALALTPWSAFAEVPRGGGEAEIHLPFRGWGLTANYQLVRIFGNTTQYTVWPYADLSALPWNTAVTYWHDGGLAADPWDWRYLYVAVPVSYALTELYRFDLSTNTVSFVAPFPAGSTPTGWNYALQGLGARCASKLGKITGGIGMYSHRRTHPVHVNYVREISTSGAEAAVLGPVNESRSGDNSQDYYSGPHWFTIEAYDSSGNTTWGVNQLSGGTIVMGTNDGKVPTGLLAYGGGSYYVSVQGAAMYRVDTTFGTSAPLSYIAWGVPAYPVAPDLIDLSNPANSCSPILP